MSALRDLFRRDAWLHQGDPAPRSRFWTYTREGWTPRHRWLPSIGGDEWCRWTLVLPIPFGGYVVIALWECRDPGCDSCEIGCTPLRAASQTSTGVDALPHPSLSAPTAPSVESS